TIFQSQVYGRHCFFSTDLSLGSTVDAMSQNAKLIKTALISALENQGPVHLNIPFEEPLYNTVSNLAVRPPKRTHRRLKNTLDADQIKRFQSLWSNAERKMILVGVLSPNALEQEIIELLAAEESLVVFTETTSNLHHDHFFPSIDKIITPLTEQEREELQPDFLLTFGGMVVSKKVKAFLRAYPAKNHWHVGEHEANNTFFSLTEHVKLKPSDFFKAVYSVKYRMPSSYRSHWLQLKAHREVGHKKYMKSIPFSDLLVFHHLLEQLPVEYKIQMGNSSAIRYAQLFNWDHSVEMFCNRGTSGIDGSTSTAIGAAVVRQEPTLFITGDLSFFYDSNALWNSYIPHTFRIVLINNSGGGIFRILPGHKNTENFDKYFETKHDLTAKQLCEMFGFKYLNAHSEKEFSDQLSVLIEQDQGPVLLEVFTPSRLNDAILLNYFEFIR
ncbi:MAG: thiamine pyrophosphate-dependent enzyme, partial [Lentisphaeria bacterium]|nr:thiamine pyrophosphate-dependent enzyme [Lentisphaeria bacterium]